MIEPYHIERRDDGTGFVYFGENMCRIAVSRWTDLRTMKPRPVDINWSCVGSVSVEDAKRFREDLDAAIDYAIRWAAEGVQDRKGSGGRA